MAVSAASALNVTGTDTDARDYTTASWTPVAGKTYLVGFAQLDLGSAKTDPTLSGNNITWTQVNARGGAANEPSLYVFRGYADGSATAGALTFSGCVSAAQTADGAIWGIVELTGVNAATDNGVVQSATGGATTDSVSATLSAFGSASNATGAWIVSYDNASTTGPAITAGSGFALVSGLDAGQAMGGDGTRLAFQFRNDNDTSVDATAAAANDRMLIVAVELKAAAVTTGTAAGSASGSGSAVGVRTVLGTGAGAATASGSASGTVTTPTVVTGVAAGAASSSGSAVGTVTEVGALICGGAVKAYIEIAFAAGSGFGVWDAGVWDTATWGPDVVWTDVSQYVMHENGISVDRAFSRDLQGWNPGTCSFVLNNTDGRFSPTNLSGPYVTAGVTEVRPWRPVRVRAEHVSSGVVYDVFRGYILSWGEVWERGADLAQTTVSCVDELASLARFDGFEQAAVGSGDTFGARMHRILNNAGHVGERNIDVGSFTFQSTTLSGNAVTELKLTADSEGGSLWIDADGTVVGEGQEAVLSDTRSNTVQWVLSDSPGAGEYPYRDVDLAYDGDLLENVVSLARSGGTEQSSSDLDSRALYGDKRYSRSDLVCENDSQVASLVALRLSRHVDPELRMTAVHVKAPRSDTDLFPMILGAKPLDRLRIERTPPGGDAINQQVFVSGVHHRFDSVQWATKFDTSSTTGYPSASETGIWDTSLWDATYWGPG